MESVEEAFQRWLRENTTSTGPDLVLRERMINVTRVAFFAGFRAGFSSPAPSRSDQVRLEDELDEFERQCNGKGT